MKQIGHCFKFAIVPSSPLYLEASFHCSSFCQRSGCDCAFIFFNVGAKSFAFSNSSNFFRISHPDIEPSTWVILPDFSSSVVLSWAPEIQGSYSSWLHFWLQDVLIIRSFCQTFTAGTSDTRLNFGAFLLGFENQHCYKRYLWMLLLQRHSTSTTFFIFSNDLHRITRLLSHQIQNRQTEGSRRDFRFELDQLSPSIWGGALLLRINENILKQISSSANSSMWFLAIFLEKLRAQFRLTMPYLFFISSACSASNHLKSSRETVFFDASFAVLLRDLYCFAPYFLNHHFLISNNLSITAIVSSLDIPWLHLSISFR